MRSLWCMRPLLALSGHADRRLSRPFSGAKRTRQSARVAAAYDPKRTLPHSAKTPSGKCIFLGLLHAVVPVLRGIASECECFCGSDI